MPETLKAPSMEEIEASKARGEQSAFNRGPDGELLDEGYTTNDLGEVVYVGDSDESTEATEPETSELESIVQFMMDSGQSDESIREVINAYEEDFPADEEVKEETPPADAPVEGDVTASNSENYSSGGKLKADSEGNTVNESHMGAKVEVDDLDASGLVELDEEALEAYFKRNIPLASTNQSGVPMTGNAVRVKLPGMEEVEIDSKAFSLNPFGPSNAELKKIEADKMQALIDHNKKLEGMPYLNAFKTDVSGAFDDAMGFQNNRIDQKQFGWIKENYKNIMGIDINEVDKGKGTYNMEYSVSDANGGILFEGTAPELQDYIYNNPPNKKQAKLLAEKTKEGRENNFGDKTVKEDIAAQTNEVVRNEFLTTKSGYGTLIANNMGLEEGEVWGDNGKTKSSTISSAVSTFMRQQKAAGLSTNSPKQFVEKFTDWMDANATNFDMEAEFNMIKENMPALEGSLAAITANDGRLIKDGVAGLRVKNIANIKEENLKNGGFQNLIVANNIHTKEELVSQHDLTKADIKNFTPTIEKDTAKFKKQYQDIYDKAGSDGITSIDQNKTTGLFTVKGNNAEVAKQYQDELNALSNTVSKKQAYYTEQSTVLNEQYNSQVKQLGLTDIELAKSMKNFSLLDAVQDDVESSFSGLVYQPGALLGNKAAINKINTSQETNAELYPEMDFSKGGWNYTARTWAQQSGVLALAIATQGAGTAIGLTEGAIATTTASMFAVGAAGGKRAELEGQLQNVDMTHQAILELESMKETMDPEQYNKSRLALVKARDDSNMSNTQKWGLIVSTGIIEGTVTRFLGTIPNLSKTWKAVTNPLDDVAGLIARKNLKATGSALFQFGKSVGGEILEEELIHFGTAGAEAAWLGKEVDFSGWQDVALSAIMVAGPMNGPGLAYSTYAQQVATKSMRENHYRVKGELGNIDAELLSLDINSETYAEDEGRILDKRQSLLGELTSMNSEMELQVMGLGAENMANMVANGRRITELSQEANVDPSLDTDTQTEQVKAYAAKLEPEARDAFMKKWDSAVNGKNDSFNKKAEWKDTIEKVYGDKGKSIYDALVKENPELKDATEKEKAIAVHEEFKKQRVDVAIGKAKSNPNIVAQVENFIYGMPWKEAESKGYERQQGAENNAYQKIGESVQADVRTGIKLIKEQSKQAAAVLGNKRLKNLKVTEAKTDEELIRETNKAYDAMYEKEAARIDAGIDSDVKGMSDADKESAKQKKRAEFANEAEQSIGEIKSGATNGIIVGGEYIVRDIKAGNTAVREGYLLAGTVMSHEISHAVDNLAFGEGGLLNYGENLFDYMADSHPEIHADVLQGQEQINNYSRQGDAFPRGKQLFFDEYTKMAQDIIQRPESKKAYDKIQKLNQSMPNALRAMTRGDYAINTPRDAAVYLGSFVDGFKNDKLGRLQERKIDAKANKRQVNTDTKKSANVSPVLHSQANAVGKEANDFYANRASNPEYSYDIAKLFEPMLGKYLNRIEAEGAILGKQDEYGQVSGDERAQNIADYKMNGMYAKRGIVDLVENGFNPEEMIEVVDPATGETVIEPNTISKYLNGVFPQRLSEFTENTTVDFGGFKVDITKAANIVTTETDQAINDILTVSVQDQLNTPLLSGITLNAEQIVVLREAVASIVGRKLPALDADVSKNRSVTPLVAALKKELAIKGSALHNLVYEIIGKSKVEVEQFLTDPKNKKMMLDALTTTWLAKNIPMAVQKYVVGIGYTTDHVGRKKGTKSGDIQAWKSSEDGPYKGMTDGKQKIRRNPNAIKDVSNAMLLSMFNKGVTMTDVKRAGLEKLSLALTQEFGLEAFKADMINEGPLKDLFVGRQDLFDRTLAGNFVEEFVRQTERGVTKYSKQVETDYGLGNPEDALTEERIGVAAYNLIKNVIQNYDKNQRYGGLEAELEGYPSYMVEAFTEAGIFEMFDTERKAKFVAPTKAMSWFGFGKAKEIYLNNGTQSKVMKDLQARNSSDMIKKLPPQLVRKLGPAFFGLGSERGLDGSFEKNDGSTGEYNWLRLEFDEAVSQPDTKEGDPMLKGLPFDINGVEMLNSSSGLMSSIETIQDMSVPKSKKIELMGRLKSRIDGANVNNKNFLTWVLAENAKLIANNPEYAAGLASLMQGATNNVKGFRAYTGLGMIKVMDGSQAPYLTKDNKPTRIKTGIVNTAHPDYSRALEFTNGNAELAGKIIIYKGEHIDPSANVNQKLFALTLELADMLSANPKALHKQILVEFQSKMDQEVQNFDQSLGTKLDSDMQDDALTSTNESAYARNLVIEDQLKHYVNTENFGAVENIIRSKTVGMLQLVGIGERLKAKRIRNAETESRKSKNPNGITVLDFDDTLATSNSEVLSTSPEGVIRKLTAEQFANEGADLLDQGWKHDFSEFNKVVDGKVASLFQKALKLQGKFGNKNMFVLTARPQQSAQSIFDFLKANGLNIPLKNITGLGNSTAEAKALWIADKVTEGYNDFYFADDAMQNVDAVKEMLERYDVKSKVQQAKRSANPSLEFNNIIQETTGIESLKQFSEAQAKIRGARTKYKSIIPASAQDFAGLIYNFIGKGDKGEADMAFFKRTLIDPFARGIGQLNTSRQNAANDYQNLNKTFPNTKKILSEKVVGDFNVDQAIRVYLWNKAGFEVPGLSKRDLKTLVEFVQGDPETKAYADGVGLISKKDNGYSKPGDFWLAENITSDLLSDGSIGDARAEVMVEWQQNADQIFSKENLNKIEAIYGSKFREALEDSLYRMRTGKNRPAGGGRIMNTYMNWVNNSVGAIMFFNMRSAILQTISATNYINWSFNNPAKAAVAFANQPQFWKDFSMLFNSPYLKQRRSGNQRGINEAELSAAVAGAENKAKAAIAWLLKKGFLPTQLADSFAIATGGAAYYRNKVKALVKEGMTQVDAEKQAFLDFQETTEVSQQSARPDMISQQQASPLGRLILSFQNTPMQYARIMNKAARDLANGRGDTKTHLSKIAYYGVAQSILFGALQSALFASMGDDEEDDFDKKKERILNGMIDSVLSGIGYGGKAVSTVKNSIREYMKQKDKGWNADHTYTILSLLSFSPPIGSKLRKIYGSIQTEQFNQGVFKKRGLTLDNPIWSGIGNVVEGFTNVPLGRIAQKMLNIDNAMDDNNSFFERAALLLGWNTWDLGIKDKDIEAVKTEIKEEKKIETKKKQKIKKVQKKKEKIEENKSVIEENKKKSKKDGVCSAVSKGGSRCKTKVVEGKLFCTVHESTTKRPDGKETQCRKRKSDKTRCKMKTTNKSGYCYYHD